MNSKTSQQPHGAGTRRQGARREDVVAFAQRRLGITLRGYQVEAARAIVRSVLENQGLTPVVMMCRQSGKNELRAVIESYLLLEFEFARQDQQLGVYARCAHTLIALQSGGPAFEAVKAWCWWRRRH